jgi:hypothetical protein
MGNLGVILNDSMPWKGVRKRKFYEGKTNLPSERI